MKVIVKTLDILEFIINGDGSPVTPKTVSNHLGINVTTCVRIMGILTARGYLQQISRREGYVPGPALFAHHGRMQWECNKIAEAAKEPVKSLAYKLNTVVNISIMQNGIKYILYHNCGRAERKILIRSQYVGDHHNTATGMLLMSLCSEKVLLDLYNNQAEEIQYAWDDIKDFESFKVKLRSIREAGEINYIDKGGLRIIGVFVKLSENTTAAIGFGYDGDDDKFALKSAYEAAKQTIKAYNMEDNVLL